jgi:hypothetical protein
MATSDRQSNRGDRPAGITCPHYEAIPGRKHCRHYLDNGACSLPTEFMCVEWMKANGYLVEDVAREPVVATPQDSIRQALASSPLDLFGNPNPDYRPAPPKGTASIPSTMAPSRRASPRRVEGTRSVPSPAEPTNASQPSPQRGLTTADIESFKALGVEVCLSSEAFGEVWLVPAYTGRDRKEITPVHAATICRVVEAFPGSRVVSFEKTPKTDEETQA